MRTFTWKGGRLVKGIKLVSDDRLGQVVFLGEAGRGRRWEKVALGRRNPADVVNGRVYKAHPVKITLPAKDKKPEKSFFVLEKPRSENGGGVVLVRVNTSWCYTKNSRGFWTTVAGEPETLISGYGAHGIAGRIGNWDDGLVVMRPGDVLRVKPEGGHKTVAYALWLPEGGDTPQTATWKDYENLQAVAKAQGLLEQAAESPEVLNVVFGKMRTFTFAGGQITKGLRVSDGATGKVIAFGESGRGRSLIEVPLVGLVPVVANDRYGKTTQIVEQAAVVKLDEKVTPAWYSWEKPTIKTIYGLTQTNTTEDAFLVRIDTSGPYTKGSSGIVESWKGQFVELCRGLTAGGAAGRTNQAVDALAVMREGDVLFVCQEGGYKSAGPWALYVQGGELKVEFWQEWKLRDAKNDPEFYVAKGTAPMGHTPSEWIGKIVTVCYLSQEQSGCGPTKTYLEDRATGELVRIGQDSVVLNLGWDGKDYHEATIGGSWVKLEKDKSVRKLNGEEAEKRKQIRIEAEELRDTAIQAMKQSYYELAEATLRHQVQDIAEEKGFDTMPTEGWYDSLTSWVEKAKAVVDKWQATEAELKRLEERKSSGEVLVDFGGHFRVMGATGNAQYWVIKPDGSEREPDEVSYRKRYTSEGDKKWRLVGPEELAISWFKAYTAADHEFVVNKLPEGGCTQDQLATVKRLEREINERFCGSVGMSGKVSPDIGLGWGLCKQTTPAPESAKPEGGWSLEDLKKKFS